MLPLLRYALNSILARPLTALATITGIASLVFTLSGSIMLLDGIDRALRDQGSPNVGVILSTGATSELASAFNAPLVPTILDSGQGRIEASVAETVAVINVPTTDGKLANVLTRGIDDKSIAFRKKMHIVEGRAPTGASEAVIGVKLRGKLRGVAVGSEVHLNKKLSLKVVGVFADDGSAYESEIWGDGFAIRTAFGKETFVSSLRVRTHSPDELKALAKAIEGDRRSHVRLMSEPDYFQSQGAMIAPFIVALGVGMSFFIGLGSSFGLAMTMFGAIAQRTREIGVLRALGFKRLQILLAFLAEALIYGLVGGLVGSLCAVALSKTSFSVRGMGWSEIAFDFAAGPRPMLIGTGVAVAVALLSGLVPAIRASRISAIAAMRNVA